VLLVTGGGEYEEPEEPLDPEELEPEE